MARPIITTAKFVGTISLGLLTGLSYTISTLAVPALIATPSALTAGQALVELQTLARRQVLLLQTIAATSLLTAYVFSPRAARHPYLLLVASIVGGNAAISEFLEGKQGRFTKNDLYGMRETEDGYEDVDVNGEQIHSVMEKYQMRHVWRAGVSGLAFALGVIGIWGDGY